MLEMEEDGKGWRGCFGHSEKGNFGKVRHASDQEKNYLLIWFIGINKNRINGIKQDSTPSLKARKRHKKACWMLQMTAGGQTGKHMTR